MNWFQHDTASTQDAKIKKLLIRHGVTGYAIYFHCLELIAGDISENNLTFELEHDSEIIASNLFIKGTADKSGIEIVEMVMRDLIELGLFSDSEGRVFCLKLLKRINMSMTSNPSFRTAINQKKEIHHDTIMTHHDVVMSRHETLPTNQPTIPTKKKETAEPSPLINTEPHNLAKLLHHLHIVNIDPVFKKTDAAVLSWAKDIEALIRLDKRTPEEIESVIRYVKTPGNFWAGNIMSGSKLKEKFPTLVAEMQRNRKGPPVRSAGIVLDCEDIPDWGKAE